ncbi:hypothetical protein [uncultured Roseobacter sp.]|uniref:hypothetical protein n=1 Tax=uncultured Roseobacter sp. TaxID=114847 RepID=UPI00261EB420|nr:hypothetical protein [uncultured Roseobacter sp.]
MITDKIRPESHVVESDVINVAAQVQLVDTAGQGQISLWRALNQVGEEVDLQRVAFECMAPHDVGLKQTFAHIRARLGDPNPAILYLHCGHQSDTRSPILQHLVPLIGAGGPIFALRVEGESAFQDAMTMARALLNEHGQVLVLRDEIRRLGRKGSTVSALRYEVLSRDPTDAHPITALNIEAVAQDRRVYT